jgi:type III restriction enzyme
MTIVLEIKGFEDEEARAKHAAANRWVEAVNNWGELGKWAYHMCRNPQLLDGEMAHLGNEGMKRGDTSLSG